MARVVDRLPDGAFLVKVPAEDGGNLEVGADVEVRRKSPERTAWPEPFGLLAGRLPAISIDDIKAARHAALVGKDER